MDFLLKQVKDSNIENDLYKGTLKGVGENG